MNISTVFLIVCSLGLALGCKKTVMPNDLTGNAGFDPDVLAKVSASACPQGQSLKIDNSALSGNFEQMNRNSRYFGFSTNGGSCILESNLDEIVDTPQSRLSFKVTLPGSCLTNRSLWMLVSSTNGDNATHSDVFQRQDLAQYGYLTINAASIMNANYLNTRLGMVVLHCQ